MLSLPHGVLKSAQFTCLYSPYSLHWSLQVIIFIYFLSENFQVLKEAQPVNAFMNIMQQMGINFGSENGNSSSDNGNSGSVHTSVSLEDIGFNCQGESKSGNASKLRKILNEASGAVENPIVICFKIGNEHPIFADFDQGKGKFSKRLLENHHIYS